MSLKNRIAQVREDIADSEALEKGKSGGKVALKTVADGCGFTAFLAAKLVSPATKMVKRGYSVMKAEYEAYQRTVAKEE